MKGKSVLVTGGAGFIARALYHRAREAGWGARFTALSRDDAKLVALSRQYPEVVTVRGDVTDSPEKLQAIIAGHQYVIHAAANKYVDRSEFAAWDTHKVNTIGTANVALACYRAGVEKALFISTDKAAAPINTYGATKFLGERLWQEANGWEGGPEMITTRYGNVIGSTGSALPKFRMQAAAGEPVTVTNPDMTRFWLHYDDALDLIEAALREDDLGGKILAPSPRASTLLTAVHAAVGDARLLRLSHRPGEKNHEIMVTPQELQRVSDVMGLDRTQGGTILAMVIDSPVADAPPMRLHDYVALESCDPPEGTWSVAEISVALADAMLI